MKRSGSLPDAIPKKVRGTRHEFLLVVVGAKLLTVAAGDSLADATLGDRVASNCETLYPGRYWG